MKSYAQFSLRRKMAGTPQAAQKFLDDVKAQVREVAKKEIVELTGLKAQMLGKPVAEVKLNNWDSSYYRDKLGKSRYNIDREALRAYFPTEASIEWVMHVSSVLYGVEFRPVSIPSWHSEVKTYAMHDAQTKSFIDALSRWSRTPSHVVAMDADWMAIERLYARERDERPGGAHPAARRQPRRRLAGARAGAVRSARTSPRAGGPNWMLCLALVHHVVITANIPLASFIDWLASLGASVVIEYVGREDEMVQALLANREDQYDDYTLETFRALLSEPFQIREEAPLKGGKRTIFFAEPA